MSTIRYIISLVTYGAWHTRVPAADGGVAAGLFAACRCCWVWGHGVGLTPASSHSGGLQAHQHCCRCCSGLLLLLCLLLLGSNDGRIAGKEHAVHGGTITEHNGVQSYDVADHEDSDGNRGTHDLEHPHCTRWCPKCLSARWMCCP